ncbi:hypothetical protein AAFF_G00380350 [Aldrovandia affinis]|uniref:Uncharacterized protein n=1 Tax=Aldrovandia affinis TaxID=143900 RepID=A0AAD7T8Z4_9TELE|nr:hypothetical protein AAFF_G00380350 [Aldrovandia affinis]
MNQLYPQVETDLLHKMVQEEELGWLDKIAKLTENIHGHIQLTKNIIEETNKDLEKTDKLFENQMQGIEEQYKASLKLVSDQQRENKEHEVRSSNGQ